MDNIRPMFPDDGRHAEVRRLQDELVAILHLPQFENMSVAEMVGVLEFLKWNLIEMSD